MKMVCAAALALGMFHAPASAATKLTVLYTAVAPSLTAFVGKDQGLFAKHGLDVELTLAANGSVIMAGVAGGSAQIGLPTPSVFVQAVDGGLDQLVLASTNVFPETSRSGVLVRPEANIHSAQDLAGHRIGVPGIGGLLDVILHQWMIDAKADPKKPIYIDTSFPQMPDLLRAGRVDAVIAVDPFFSRILDQKIAVALADPGRVLPAGAPGSLYTANGDWVRQNQATVAAFQAALDETVAFIRANEAASREALAHYIKLPPEVMATVAIPNIAVRLKPEQLQIWIDICRQQGLISGDLSAAKLIVPWMAGPG